MDLTKITETLASSPTLAAIGIAALVLFFGFRLLAKIDFQQSIQRIRNSNIGFDCFVARCLGVGAHGEIPDRSAHGVTWDNCWFLFRWSP
jgi:hypothetical protein